MEIRTFKIIGETNFLTCFNLPIYNHRCFCIWVTPFVINKTTIGSIFLGCIDPLNMKINNILLLRTFILGSRDPSNMKTQTKIALRRNLGRIDVLNMKILTISQPRQETHDLRCSINVHCTNGHPL